MLREAINAIAHGNPIRARDLLTRLLRADQTNPDYWLWLSAVVDTNKERIYCLQNTLRLDPTNQKARLGLVLFGVLKPENKKKVLPIIYRDWSAQFDRVGRMRERRFLLSRVGLGLMGIFLIGFLVLGFLVPRPGVGLFSHEPHLTITPRFDVSPATPTLLPTNTPWKITPTPTYNGPIPLEEMLQVTYTPTPLYVNTPHPVSEAYRAGIRALQARDLESMLRYMQQAARDEPESADTHYYVGEAFRLLGDNQKAFSAYTHAIQTQTGFAPAYLGRARVNLSLGNLEAAEEDLQMAIELDPDLIEASVEMAGLYLKLGDLDTALASLDRIRTQAAASPLWHYYRSLVASARGETQIALDSARKAHELDITFLPAYLALGQALVAAGDPHNAIEYLETYLSYEGDDPFAWLTLGEATYLSGENYDECVSAMGKALSDEEGQFKALLYRGLCYLELREGQLAVNDLIAARNLDRSSFIASLGLGRSLMMTERMVEAVSQFIAALELAGDDRQRAEVYYWRSLAYQSLGNIRLATNDWELLITLPPDYVPEQWRSAAQSNLLLLTPSPTASPTSPVTITVSPTPINTPTATGNPP